MLQDLARDGTPAKLEAVGLPVLARLRIEHIVFQAKNGPRAGETISYRKPVLTVVRPWSATVYIEEHRLAHLGLR